MNTILKIQKTIFFFIFFLSLGFSQHFNVEISETGESTLFIFQDSIDGLSVGDELGLFDSNGITDDQGGVGEILVGSGIWTGNQIEIITIMAVDLSEFGGPILPGAVSGNTMSLKVWNASEELESEVTYSTSSGSGSFNGLFTAIDTIVFGGSCEDDNSAVAKALSKLKTAKAKYFGGIIHEAWSGPLKGTTGIGKVEDEFYTSIRHPKDGKGWISFIDMKGPGSFKFENTVIGKEKDEDTGIIYDTFKYYITGVEGNKIICGNTEPDKTKQKAILENDVIQKAFGLGEYDSRTLWKTRSFVNSRLGNKNTFFGIVTDLLSKSDVAEEVGELLLDSILKTSLASEAAGAIQKKKCSNCHFAFSLVTAIGKYDPKNTKITEGDVKENPVIQSVISSLVKDNNNAKWFIAEDKILAELKRTEATDAGREPPAKLFFTIGIQGNKGSAHNVLNLQVRYKGTFSPWPQFLGEMSDEFIQMLKDNKKQFKFTSDCGK